MKTTIGGDRLGSGQRQTVDLKTYERSTHDLSYLWRSTMSAGTLVPFLKEVALPGDTHDIDLDCDIKTHPTVGPLFGSFKVQLDLFAIPVRLYQAQLHNNKLGIGMKMNQIKLPQISMAAVSPKSGQTNLDNSQINPSCILSYLDIRGLGTADPHNVVVREFNAIPYLAYWDIYKNYYANTQEEKGAVIHNSIENLVVPISVTGRHVNEFINWTVQFNNSDKDSQNTMTFIPDVRGEQDLTIIFDSTQFKLYDQIYLVTDKGTFRPDELFNKITTTTVGTDKFICSQPKRIFTLESWQYPFQVIGGIEPKVKLFDLSNIDDMREDILSKIKDPTHYVIDHNTPEPYGLPFQWGELAEHRNQQFSQEGLALKTYQSDMFNNWMNREWIDGDTGVNQLTAIDVSDGKLTIDQFQLARKVYDMLNRVAISGGRYDDWLDAVYTHERPKTPESPMYLGGLIKELVFDEVISNAEAGEDNNPLGTLAGRGVMSNKHKGGRVHVKTNEPSYIMGIISITPRIDYSQGNKWDTNLKTMDDFHKPGLDEIGFEDVVTDAMAWWDTKIVNLKPVFKSAGKRPAWMNYMTNVNQTRGNFAIENNQMFMTLNRKYEAIHGATGRIGGIQDLTTYMDPVKFNHIFAEKARDAQNFWVRVAVDITARRKMSAKIMPNL